MKNKMYAFPIGVLSTILFFLIGFLSGKWEIAWLVFLLNPIFFWYVQTQKRRTEQEKKNSTDDGLDF